MNNTNCSQIFARIVSKYIFADSNFDSKNCTVYTHVPLTCINSIRDGIKRPAIYQNRYSAMNNRKIDIVFCIKNEIALCVLFNPDMATTKLLEGPLHGIPVVNPSPSYSTNDFANYAKSALTRYLSKSTSEHIKYELDVYSINSIIPKIDGESINDTLMKTHIIDENSEITDFGNACGIMCCFSSGNSEHKTINQSFKASKNSCKVFDLNKYFKFPSLKNRNQLLPLKDKLKCIELGIPCNEAYGQILTEKLKAFLNMPLREIMSTEKSMYFQLRNDIEKAEELIHDTVDNFPLTKTIVTYGDLMDFLYRMNKLTMSEKYNNSDLKLRFSNIIVSLGNFVYSDKQERIFRRRATSNTVSNGIRKVNLKKQLDAISDNGNWKNSVFSMISGHYCYAASLLTGSNYPNWLYRENLLKDPYFGLNCQYPQAPKRSVAEVISDARIAIFENMNDEYEATDTYAEFVFALLVLPVADINSIKNINSKN